VVNDSGDRTVSFYKRRLRVSNKRYKETFGQIVKRDKDTT